MPFDAARARLSHPDLFPRFRVQGDGVPLAEKGLSPETLLLVFERGGQSRALLVTQMTWHHVAQGELAGEPYVISF